MTWKPRKTHKGKSENYSMVRKLRKENRSSEEFEVFLNQLSLEEVIALKLELATVPVGGKLYGLPLWQSMPDIVKEAVFKYAVSATKTKGEAARFLGLTPASFYRLQKKFDIDEYFFVKNENSS